MINITEILFHAQHKRSYERFHLHRGRIHCSSRNEQSENLCAELTIQEQTLLVSVRLHQSRHFSGFTCKTMVSLAVFRLDFSAILTDSKSFAYLLNTRNRQLFSGHITLTEVNLTEGCFANELISERKIFIVHAICTGNVMVLIYVNQKLFAVEDVISVIALIVDQTLSVIHVGVDHLNFQHSSDLSSVSPCRTTALRTSRCILAGFFNLSMRTIRAKSPSCGLSSSQINLIDGKFTAIDIKTVVRRKLANS